MNGYEAPSPSSLLRAYRTSKRLSRFVGLGKARDIAGKEMWDSVVEGRRGIAVMTAYLAETTEDEVLAAAYQDAWEKMVKG
jgi:hypothetical protein